MKELSNELYKNAMMLLKKVFGELPEPREKIVSINEVYVQFTEKITGDTEIKPLHGVGFLEYWLDANGQLEAVWVTLY